MSSNLRIATFKMTCDGFEVSLRYDEMLGAEAKGASILKRISVITYPYQELANAMNTLLPQMDT